MKKMLTAVVALVLLGGGGAAGAYFWPRGQASASASSSAVAEKPKPRERGLITFEPFVANLADPGSSRFIRTTLQLVISSPKGAEKLDKASVQAIETRAAILEILTTQTADALSTPEGKAALKKKIVERTNELLEDTKVLDVLFTDFVIQY
jgi:flagellar FliL protein